MPKLIFSINGRHWHHISQLLLECDSISSSAKAVIAINCTEFRNEYEEKTRFSIS